jgi:hypothetical protein
MELWCDLKKVKRGPHNFTPSGQDTAPDTSREKFTRPLTLCASSGIDGARPQSAANRISSTWGLK